MHRWLVLLVVLVFISPQALWATPPQLTGKVTWVYDGDTLELAGVGKVRLLGIDCPEGQGSPRDNYYLQQGLRRETLRRVADEAKRFLMRDVKGQQLTLQFDRQQRDRHGRLLAYAYLPDGRHLNRLLLEQGMAAVYRKFEFTLKNEFLAAEERAKKSKLGIWGEQG